MAANARTVEFEAVPLTDGEFSFGVDGLTFERLTGRLPTDADKVRPGDEFYRVYPDMLAAAFRDRRKVRVSLDVTPLPR